METIKSTYIFTDLTYRVMTGLKYDLSWIEHWSLADLEDNPVLQELYYAAKVFQRYKPRKPANLVCYHPDILTHLEMVITTAKDIFLRDEFLSQYGDLNADAEFDQISKDARKALRVHLEGHWDELYARWFDLERIINQDPALLYGQLDWYADEAHKGFGVIKREGREYFVHRSNLKCDERLLDETVWLSFYARPRKKKGLEAYDVDILPQSKARVKPTLLRLKLSNVVSETKKYDLNRLSPGEMLVLTGETGRHKESRTIQVERINGTPLGYLEHDYGKALGSMFERFGKLVPSYYNGAAHVIFPVPESLDEPGLEEFSRLIARELFRIDQRVIALEKDPPKIYRVKVVGVTFEGRQAVVEQLAVGEPVTLKRESTNPHDRNAIRVEHQTGIQIGYIGRWLAHKLASKIDAYGKPIPGRVIAKTGSCGSSSKIGVQIEFVMPEDENNQQNRNS